ncbi:hypothetical protein ACFX2K_022653 [Malus domestica]
MADQSENPSSPSGQVVLESPTASERSEGNGTSEELQVTMIQVLKSMERISLETKGEVSRLCTLTGNLQRRLDLKFSTPKGAQGSGMSQVVMRNEPIIPLFPLLEEEKDRGKKKVAPEGSQPVIEPVLERELPSFPVLSFNNRKPSEQERTRYGMPATMGETSGKEGSSTADKPPPYRPPPLVNKGRGTSLRKPEPRREASAGNDRSPKIEPALFGHNDTLATQQLREELPELRRAMAQNAQPRARPVFRITYQKPYPEYVDELNPFPLNFKMPAFPIFTGEDSSVSSRDHIFKFSNHCVAYEDNPNYKLRLFGNSLAGLTSQWYSLLPPNFIADWGQMEMAFHEQFYRIEPELIINDLVEVKQYDHESTEDFMMRFRRTRMRCQFPVNQAQLISIAQRALKLPLRKRFYDAQFNELQELMIAATKYERLLQEEQQMKHTSKVPHFYKSKVAIHRVEVGEARPEHEDGRNEEDVDVCAAKMTTPLKPLTVKGLVQPVNDQKVVMNDGGFVPIKPPKYQSYSFDLSKTPEIYEELVRARVILPDNTKKMPKPEELRGKKYYKEHYTFNHSIVNCVQFRDWIQDLIVKGKLLLDLPQASMMVDTNPFPKAPINMINLILQEAGSPFGIAGKENGPGCPSTFA